MEEILATVKPFAPFALVFVALVWIVAILAFVFRRRAPPRPEVVEVDPITALNRAVAYESEHGNEYYIQTPSNRGPMFVQAVLADEHAPLGASVRRRKQRRSRKSKRV
jgi:hypothetical protein